MSALSARRVIDTLAELGVTHVLGIPDNATAKAFDLLRSHERVRLLTVTREGEAFAIAAGLWIGGGVPVVLIQGTGLLESGDSIRGTVTRMGVPVLSLIGYRGYAKMTRAGLDPAGPRELATLRREDVDSAALHLEPTLRAWDIPFWTLEPGEEASVLERAWARANDEERATAALIPSALC